WNRDRVFRGFGVTLRSSFSPLWEKVSPKATDEGCSREHQRLTPLEHPSSVSALPRRSTFSHKGEKEEARFTLPNLRALLFSLLK
ncbi:hypothetical protein, partial [Mesorhizobium sp. B2-3-5]|uniref:hypothetical protein n=1 Tax=Mesorhizobium sp. B2-3-5 TaxID=2589958 RepID=UPI001AEDC0FD